jgi:hypothetical protein
MQATESLIQFQAEHVRDQLLNLGYENQRLDSKYIISVYVPKNERLRAIQHISSVLPGAIHDTTYSGSSVGAIKYLGGRIKMRPFGTSAAAAPGLSNESFLVDSVNKFLKNQPTLNTIEFHGTNNASFIISDATELIQVGSDTANRKKADVIVSCRESDFKLSLKKSSAEYWESADTYFGSAADEIITDLLSQNKISLSPTTKVDAFGNQIMKLSREIAIRATKAQANDVIFGSDLGGDDGAVLKETFTTSSFSVINNSLRINCASVILDLADVATDQEVYFLIRNDSSRRRPNHMYPGIRVTAAYRSRLSSKTLMLN